MKDKKNILIFSIFSIFIILISLNFVSAFAVSSTYMKDKQLYIMPGGTSEVRFLLQNGDGNDVNVMANIQSVSGVAQIIDKREVYLIPAGTDQAIYVNIIVPSNASIGEKYPVSVSFDIKPIVPGQALSFGSSINQNFEVNVGIRPGEEPPIKKKIKIDWILILVILILILAGIIIIVNYLSKKRKAKKPVKKGH